MNNELKTKILNILFFDFSLRPYPAVYNIFQIKMLTQAKIAKNLGVKRKHWGYYQ